jgi:N-glycosylase/DNA lyase
VNTWITIAKTIKGNWGSFKKFFESTNRDFLNLKQLVNVDHKKGFPYLSGPKIFNYWSFIISTYGGVKLSNRDHIEIAPDTHITQCSVRLGVITPEEATSLTKDAISERWRELLKESGIDPIDMHSPLWFWSRNGFLLNFD